MNHTFPIFWNTISQNNLPLYTGKLHTCLLYTSHHYIKKSRSTFSSPTVDDKFLFEKTNLLLWKQPFILRSCSKNLLDKVDLDTGRIIDRRLEGASAKPRRSANFIILPFTERLSIFCSVLAYQYFFT